MKSMKKTKTIKIICLLVTVLLLTSVPFMISAEEVQRELPVEKTDELVSLSDANGDPSIDWLAGMSREQLNQLALELNIQAFCGVNSLDELSDQNLKWMIEKVRYTEMLMKNNQTEKTGVDNSAVEPSISWMDGMTRTQLEELAARYDLENLMVRPLSDLTDEELKWSIEKLHFFSENNAE